MNAAPFQPSSAETKAKLKRSFFLCTADGLVAMPVVTMSQPVNVFLTALVTQAFPLSDTAIGLFSAVPFVGNFLQIFLMPELTRWRRPKTLTVIFAGLHLVCWVSLAFFLPLLPHDDPARAGRWLIAWFFTSSIFAAVAGVSWNSWVQEWAPARLRGKFFARRNRLLQISTLTFLLVAGWAVGHWHYAIPVFQVVIAAAAVLRVCSLHFQWISPAQPLHPPEVAPLSLGGQFHVLRDSHSLLAFIGFGCVWAFAVYCFGPFYQVFMFRELGMSSFSIGLTAALSQMGGALSLPAWGLLLDRYGNKPVMVVSLLLWQIPNFFWYFIAPANSSLLFILWIWAGATSAGFVLGQFTFLLRLIPLHAKDLAIGFNLAITSLFAASAPIIGGHIIQHRLAMGLSGLAVYHTCFLLQPILAMCGAFLLLRVREPAASSVLAVVGAMRSIRTLGGVLGLSFLTNYVFLRRPRSRHHP